MPATKIRIDQVIATASEDRFWAVRAKAIQAYAGLEQSLCSVFQQITNVAPDMAGVIFFKITDARARSDILDCVIRKRFGTTYNLFWNSFRAQLRDIDAKRNAIVHWMTAHNIGEADSDGKPIVKLTLVPPGFLHSTGPMVMMDTKDLNDFMGKCDIFSRLCNMFLLALSGKMGEGPTKTWLDIFQQPLLYPLPSSHPLSAKFATPPTSAPPSKPSP
jgi:hypothetical protein